MRKFTAFTLAEVLITIGIIGVVAAMTLPVLEHHQKVTTVAKLKEVYSILSQAKTMTEQEWGTFDTQLSSEQFFKTYFAPYLKITNVCKSREECYGKAIPKKIGGKVDIPGTSYMRYMVTLPSGAFVGFASTPGGELFYVDINGRTNPNIEGRDIFYFFLVNPNTTLDKHTDGGCQAELASIQKWESGALFPGGLAACYIPHGTLSRKQLLDKNTHRSCNPNTAANEGGGNACAALIMKDNWQIAPDYPW